MNANPELTFRQIDACRSALIDALKKTRYTHGNPDITIQFGTANLIHYLLGQYADLIEETHDPLLLDHS